jgi:hypothetical protein
VSWQGADVSRADRWERRVLRVERRAFGSGWGCGKQMVGSSLLLLLFL